MSVTVLKYVTGLIALALVALLGFVSLVGCSGPSGPPVRLVVPDGFKGLIKIVYDPRAPRVRVRGGEYAYEISSDGVLRVRKTARYENWHYVRASFSSGQEIATIYPVASDGITLFSIGRSDGALFYFLGSQKEKDAAMQQSLHLVVR
jgi:hypothetical protein